MGGNAEKMPTLAYEKRSRANGGKAQMGVSNRLGGLCLGDGGFRVWRLGFGLGLFGTNLGR
ncbi:unnamed protein product [Prunus armeniaca]|uniref:Uncharacterized protein n=1 Tax=Prunus armeniaca TaxID=36596 RepID=A0A6J5WXI6_PRUAR|nr:unnamed protein product [Prunus armeniaca]